MPQIFAKMTAGFYSVSSLLSVFLLVKLTFLTRYQAMVDFVTEGGSLLKQIFDQCLTRHRLALSCLALFAKILSKDACYLELAMILIW